MVHYKKNLSTRLTEIRKIFLDIWGWGWDYLLPTGETDAETVNSNIFQPLKCMKEAKRSLITGNFKSDLTTKLHFI